MRKKPSQSILTCFILSIFFNLVILSLSQASPLNDSVIVPADTAGIINHGTTESEYVWTSARCDVHFFNGRKLKNVNLVINADSVLYAVKGKHKTKVLYSDIRKINFKSVNSFGNGFVKGALAGFALGFLKFGIAKGGLSGELSGWGIGALIGVVLSVPGGLIGGLVNSLISTDEEFVFEQGSSPDKIMRVKHVIIQKSH